MIRPLPHAVTRARRVAMGLVVGCVVAAGLGAPMAEALSSGDNDLHSREDQIEDRIAVTRDHLDEVSQRLMAATAALREAEDRLGEAREELAQARGQVSAAKAVDQEMQGKLDAAEQRLADARSALRSSRNMVVRQRSQVATFAVEQFQGDHLELAGLSAVLGGESPLAVSNQIAAVDGLLNQGAADLDRLRATRVLLVVQERQVQGAKQRVAELRAKAAERLAFTQRVKVEAQLAKQDVLNLVRSRALAQQEAKAAVKQELRRLAELRAERERIRDILVERAREALANAGISTGSLRPGSYTGRSMNYLDFPVIGGTITSPYGIRMHPILQVRRLHDGTDIGAPCGTPVYAASGGLVLEAYHSESYGNRVMVADGVVHGVSLSTSYSHLSRMKVSAGDRVRRGEVIGFVGSTGLSTGCHLHFSVYVNGYTVDPESWL